MYPQKKEREKKRISNESVLEEQKKKTKIASNVKHRAFRYISYMYVANGGVLYASNLIENVYLKCTLECTNHRRTFNQINRKIRGSTTKK